MHAHQVGDGTTTVVILAGELLRECKAFIEEGVHPRAIIRSFRQAATLAVQHVQVRVQFLCMISAVIGFAWTLPLVILGLPASCSRLTAQPSFLWMFRPSVWVIGSLT